MKETTVKELLRYLNREEQDTQVEKEYIAFSLMDYIIRTKPQNLSSQDMESIIRSQSSQTNRIRRMYLIALLSSFATAVLIFTSILVFMKLGWMTSIALSVLYLTIDLGFYFKGKNQRIQTTLTRLYRKRVDPRILAMCRELSESR